MKIALLNSRYIKPGLSLFVAFAFALSGCAGSPSRFHASYLPPGSLTVAQVTSFATKTEIVGIPTLVASLEVAGLNRDQIEDGMVADGRTFCCGGPSERDFSLWFYVPKSSSIAIGDVVEIKVGADVNKSEVMRARPNMLSRLVSKQNEVGNECRWVPEDPKLWTRVLYCDWMETEGWIKQEGIFNVWIRNEM